MLAASPVVIYLLHGSAFAVDFAILRSHFWNRQTVPKWNRESAFLLFFNRSHFWNRVPVHFLFFLYQGCRSATFWFSQALWLMATGRATREALLSEVGFEKLFRTQSCFVDDLVL